MRKTLVLISLFCLFLWTGCVEAREWERGTPAYEHSLLRDLPEREKWGETEVPRSLWYTPREVEGWGPMPRVYPGVERLIEELPPDIDAAEWKRDRVVAIAKHYIGLPYRHHHIPAWSPKVGSKLNPQPGPGLDCSNFTAWVYNFGFGISIHGDVEKQSQMEARPGFAMPPGVRRIERGEGFLPGDILYILDKERRSVVHAVIYVDEEHIIDSTDSQVNLRHFTGWYRQRLSHGIRFFE